MSLKLRLARAGTKKRPYYHIVIADVRSPRDGRFIETVGAWNPLLPREGGERIICYEALDERRESLYVANTILLLQNEQGYVPGDFAVIFVSLRSDTHSPVFRSYS